MVIGGYQVTLPNVSLVDYSEHPWTLLKELSIEQAEPDLPPDEDEWGSEPGKAKVCGVESNWSHVVHLAFKQGVLDALDQDEVVRSFNNTVEGEWLLASMGRGKTGEVALEYADVEFIMERVHLIGCWKTIASWRQKELPAHAPPMGPAVLSLMFDTALECGCLLLAASIALAFTVSCGQASSLLYMAKMCKVAKREVQSRFSTQIRAC